MAPEDLTWYLAGPMSGVPRFNIPLFDATAAKLRAKGLFIVSPAELDSPTMRELALASPDGDLSKLEKDTKETWGEVLARDVKMIADSVGGLIFLPYWWTSRGARLEAFVGLLTGKQFAFFTPAGTLEIDSSHTQEDILEEVGAAKVRSVMQEFMP